MPLDPIVSLAVALAEAPGACACLLGAGVSRDAGVPTAWEVRRDGVGRLYRLENNSTDTPDDEALEKWLEETGRPDLDYSSVLDLIAPDQAIRRELLDEYFKDAKPGEAHERLASLAAAGVIRVFITTNFERLLEQALEARGIKPIVVSDDATLVAAPRREHSQVFIVKAHGDYKQETIRNTADELAELSPNLTEELRAIANHYGLLVIGWSGRDEALATILRQRNSRYGAWWLSRSESPVEPAATVIETMGARMIVRPGASEFLGDLERHLAVYQAHPSGDDPGSVHDQVRELVKGTDAVALDEVMRRERYAFERVLDGVRADFAQRNGSLDTAREVWAILEPATERRLASLIPVALYRPELFAGEIRAHLAWASSAPARDGLAAWLQPWELPFWVLGMALGGLCVRLERYASLKPMLSGTWTTSSDWPEPFIGGSQFGEMIAKDMGPSPEGQGNWYFPAWQWLLVELPGKEWLVERYPEWLRPENEPKRSFVELAFLLDIAAGFQGEGPRLAWWSLDSAIAVGFARRLNRDSALRKRVAEDAIGVTLELFDERAPEIVKASIGWQGMFFSPDQAASALQA